MHINRGKQVFISKIYFPHNFDLFKNINFPQFLPIFRSKFTQKAQNYFFLWKKFWNWKNEENKIIPKSNFTICDVINFKLELIWHRYQFFLIFLIFNFFKFLPKYFRMGIPCMSDNTFMIFTWPKLNRAVLIKPWKPVDIVFRYIVFWHLLLILLI